MDIKVFQERPEISTTVNLRLFQDGKSVTLRVVDETGSPVYRGALLRITQGGVVLISHVLPEFGFPLDDNGFVKTDM